MLTSPRTNGVDHFVPSHHLALITQPVLGARSRKKTTTTTNLILETSTKDKFDSMSNSRRSSYNDSPPLTFPINRVDPSQYQKKSNSNSHHESSDSGLDLSLSTNSSVQYPLQHTTVHRPLSALNEDSNPDDGYHEEHQQPTTNAVRLRLPPVSLGRNRSMEDMINNNTHEQQHRSSSFSDERLQNLSLKQEQKMKRSSDGALLDLLDTSPEMTTELYRHKNDWLYLPPTQQHRSLNDLTNKPSNKVLSIRNESTNINNLSTTHTIVRKPNTSTLKPLRKKNKLNIIVESSLPLTSARLPIYDEQINAMTGTNSSSSNQTTPRSNRPSVQQQQVKPKAATPLGHYPNQEQMRAHVNRSVLERQHPPSLLIPPRRGVIKQIIPFDASPSKVNNLLLRHHVQYHYHQHPATIFHPNSNIHGGGGVDIPITHNSQFSPSRQKKHMLPILYTEETILSIPDGKRKQKEEIKIEKLKEQEERKQRLKQKEEIENHQKGQIRIKVKDIQQSKFTHKREDSQDYIDQRHFPTYIPKHRLQQEDEETEQIENILTGTPRQRRDPLINDSNRYDSGQSINPQDGTNINRRLQRNEIFTGDRSDGTKPTGLSHRNNTINRATESNSQFGLDYPNGTQRNTLVNIPSRPSKAQFQTFGTPIVQSQTEQNRQWQNSKYGTDHQSWQKSQGGSTSTNTRIQPILSTNSSNSDLRRERETSRLSNISKAESTQTDEKQFKQTKIIERNSLGSFQSKSPTSWSIISEHQNGQKQFDIYEKTNNQQSESSTSSSSRQESSRRKSGTPSPTYRLMITEEEQPRDGRYVMPTNNSQISSLNDPSHTSSQHTLPFTCTPDSENGIVVDEISQHIRTKEQKSIVSDVYTLSDRDSSQKTIDRLDSPSPLVHLSSNKKFHSPPVNEPISTGKDEIISNYDSDDGWSDDSAELLYVDERYATQTKKMNSSSHLPSQQHYHYKVQQQNVLLQ